MKRVFITTAIDYPNALPHVGTAFEKIGADIQVRYQRQIGNMVRFQMGNDENTIKVLEAAKKANVDVFNYCKDMKIMFERIWRTLDIDFDEFIQTSSSWHHKKVEEFISMIPKEYFYKKKYSGLYCTGCEEFKQVRDLENNKCSNHPNSSLENVSEENWFFKLTAFKEKLEVLLEKPNFILPTSRKPEIKKWLENLEDVSITRNQNWGIKFPLDESQRIYVWFDALLNYWTYGYWHSMGFQAQHLYWPPKFCIVGKDITRFHCLLLPAMLMAAGMEIPETIYAHGFIYYKGKKQGKSNNPVYLPELIERFGSDALRFYFGAKCPFRGDTNFSIDDMVNQCNANLANNLGNLVNRTASMIVKYFDGTLPKSNLDENLSWKIIDENQLLLYKENMSSFDYDKAMTMIFEISRQANLYIDQNKPWELAKEDKVKLKTVLKNVVAAIQVIAYLIKPVMPKASGKIDEMFSYKRIYNWYDFERACKNNLCLIEQVSVLKKVKPIFEKF